LIVEPKFNLKNQKNKSSKFLFKKLREWPKPVLLEEWGGNTCGTIKAWPNEKDENIPDQTVEQMPIIMTQFPEINTIFNVTEMNIKVIENTFRKGNVK
jgi:poly(A) polymerase Pap1